MASQSGPNPITVGLSILRARRVRRPAPSGTNSLDHGALGEVLEKLRVGSVPSLAGERENLAEYRDTLAATDPDTLAPSEALAYWLNMYNAGALDIAAETVRRDEPTVLRVAGGFRRQWASVAGEALSLDDIEHGKIRRFRDPRIHGALVCGSASCPTLRYEPFDGAIVGEQLEDQMKIFLTNGGAVADRTAGVLHLSRVFLWYGADFTRPNRMPTLLPARKSRLIDALARWFPDEIEQWRLNEAPKLAFQSYDWSLACTIG